uniref:Uncharacterized protein n=1 Tax=viral metagenome TaxID=1070528 RepID=A0A6C0EKP5_9ZZZZ
MSLHYKVLLVGDADVGKTTFLTRFKTGEFRSHYVPTHSMERHTMNFDTSKGKVTIDFWDCAGDDRFRGMEDAYYCGADASILFFDLSNEKSYSHVYAWCKKLILATKKAPIVVCGTKTDLTRKVLHDYYEDHLGGRPYCEISSKTGRFLSRPVLHVLQLLLKDNTLQIV